MFLDAVPPPAPSPLVHLRRYRFLYLSAVLHVVPLAVLRDVHERGNRRIEAAREQQSVSAGTRLTQQARLEQRVHDMARIESLLAQSTGAGGTSKDDDVRFSAQPEAPDALLKTAQSLAQTIEKIERETKAERLAKLLGISKEKALAQVDAPKPPAPATPAAQPTPTPKSAPDAATQIAQLEAKARAALEARRQQLERQRGGTPVTAGAAHAGGAKAPSGRPGPGGQGGSAGSGKGSGTGGDTTGIATQGVAGRKDGPAPLEIDNAAGAASASVLDRINAFTNRDLPEKATQAYAAGGMLPFFNSGIGHIPDLAPGAQIKGAGRVIGAGGAYANRVYVNRWYLIGPFEGRHGAGLFATDRYPPEQAVVLDAVYRGKAGRLLRWEYVDLASYPLVPADAAEDAVYYGYTELMMDREQDLTLWVGADDDAQVWLNDRQVWRGGNVNKEWFFGEIYETWNTYVRDYNLNEGKRTVHLRKGRNKLFFKLANGPTRVFLSMVLTR